MEASAPDSHTVQPRHVDTRWNRVVLAALVALEPAQVDVLTDAEHVPAGLAGAHRRVTEPDLQDRPVAGVEPIGAHDQVPANTTVRTRGLRRIVCLPVDPISSC